MHHENLTHENQLPVNYYLRMIYTCNCAAFTITYVAKERMQKVMYIAMLTATDSSFSDVCGDHMVTAKAMLVLRHLLTKQRNLQYNALVNAERYNSHIFCSC